MSPSPYEPVTARFSQVCPKVVTVPPTGKGDDASLTRRSLAFRGARLKNRRTFKYGPCRPHAPAILPPGTPVPDFTLHSTPDQAVSLHDFRGWPVVLAFYPADWSPVCGNQMTPYSELSPSFPASAWNRSACPSRTSSAISHSPEIGN